MVEYGMVGWDGRYMYVHKIAPTLQESIVRRTSSIERRTDELRANKKNRRIRVAAQPPPFFSCQSPPCTMTMNDSLPYVDASNEEYEDYAAQLVEEEMKRLAPRQMEPLPPLRFRSPLMQGEYQRLSTDRQSPAVTDSVFPQTPAEDTIEAWEAAVRQAKIAYEKERLRKMLLKLSKEGSTVEQWKHMNTGLEKMKSDLEKMLQEQKARVDAVNLQRQNEQQKMGQELHILSTQYDGLIDKTQQLRQAIAELKEELRMTTNG